MDPAVEPLQAGGSSVARRAPAGNGKLEEEIPPGPGGAL